MASITVPASSVLSLGTGAHSNTPVGTTGGGAPVETDLGSGFRRVYTGPGPTATMVGVRDTVTGAFVPASQPLRSREWWERQDRIDAERDKQKPAKPRPTRPSRPAGGTGGGATFTGAAPDRVAHLMQMQAHGANVARPNGTLTPETQAALVQGLDAEEFTPALVALIDPTYSINFLVYDDGKGRVTYIDAQLETPASLAAANHAPTMDFESAYFETEAGKIIARKAWVDESGAITKMLKRTDQGWFVGTEGAWVIVTSARGEDPGNLSIGDLEAVDWFVVG